MKSVLSLSLIFLAGCSTVPENEADHQRRQAKAHGDVINTLDPATVYNQQQNGSGLLLDKNPTYKNSDSKYMFRHVH